jgi:G:T-mismatch repair DNA endonuclease (very short patch repair protein)
VAQSLRITYEEFLERANEIHQGKYDYSLIKNWGNNNREYIDIICPKHGKYSQSVKNHLGGHGCSDCGGQCSKMACEWIQQVAKDTGQHIICALDGKEKTIPAPDRKLPYRVDGYCEETNTVYEFHGCIWHGCPKCFDREYINPITGKQMAHLHEATIAREKAITNAGYNLQVMWECGYTKVQVKKQYTRKHEVGNERIECCTIGNYHISVYDGVCNITNLHYKASGESWLCQLGHSKKQSTLLSKVNKPKYEHVTTKTKAIDDAKSFALKLYSDDMSMIMNLRLIHTFSGDIVSGMDILISCEDSFEEVQRRLKLLTMALSTWMDFVVETILD